MNRLIIVAHTGTGGERGRIMDPNGVCVSLSATDYKDPPKVIVEQKTRCVYQNGSNNYKLQG